MQEIILDLDEIRSILPLRRYDAHKGSTGKVLVIAGSRGMSGAAVLASQAVLRAGAGLVTLATAASLSDLIDVHNPEVMTFPLLETTTGSISKNAFQVLIEVLERFDTVLIGPGISTNESSLSLVSSLLQYISQHKRNLKVILDADGLRALTKIYRPLQMSLIITPHFGELARLIRYTVREISAKPYYYARKVADKYNCVVILKSHQTYICSPHKSKYFLNVNGNAGMAKAGSGDVLAGLVTGLWASSRISPLKAAVAAPYIHAMAGNLAVNKRSIDGIIASDILAEIPAALRAVKGI